MFNPAHLIVVAQAKLQLKKKCKLLYPLDYSILVGPKYVYLLLCIIRGSSTHIYPT